MMEYVNEHKEMLKSIGIDYFDSNSIKDDEWHDIDNITIRCKLSKFINGVEE